MGRIFPVVAVFLLLFVTACGKPENICKQPYIEYKMGECCLDQNSNNVCDKDETSAPPIEKPSTPSGTVKVSNNAAVYTSIPTATYNQFTTFGDSLVDYNLTNGEDTPMTVTLLSIIQGYTDEQRDTVTIPAKSSIIVKQTPLLKPDVEVTEVKNANFYSRVFLTSNPDMIIDEGTMPITLYPRDTMIWTDIAGDTVADYSQWIVAWVTPHIPEVNELIRIAADYNDESTTMSGYVCSDCKTEADWLFHTTVQVKALYRALQDKYKVTYVNAPIAFSTSEESSQRVRLPRETLALSSANCIDGTVLFASALEALGINPIIILTSDHSFVCWELDPDGKYSIGCLETTMIGDSDFIDALDEGNKEYQQEKESGHFDTGESRYIPVKVFRDAGIRPIE